MASSREPSNWIEWLQNQHSNSVFNSKPSDVAKLCAGTDATKCFENLSKCKNLPLLTRALTGKKLQVTFYHSVIGIPFMSDDIRYVARVGSVEGPGVGLDSRSIFRQTSAMHVPSTVDLLKVETPEDLEKVVADTNKAKKKAKALGVLAPSLGRRFYFRTKRQLTFSSE